ncbi:endonuclease/exonuclease/phosphatase family protein [Mycobacterium sp. UM_CSW]|uniref:endonuclease/exonuclease/phosphatase family protein n=1 Tax=Mycobacterium sp. UM_CSW TaxID=1370119 RepID=UPI001EF9FC24|nr:endonuclease/exonuclease/phosphatase family protein [Mycobacterium sp. UM_CSW]
MRVLNWNISHGGGSRVQAICQHIEDVHPDLLALTEFQTRNETLLRAHLQRLGYPFIATSNPTGHQNGLLAASKWQIDHTDDQHSPDIDRERWLAVCLNAFDLDVLILHIPGTPDHKFQDGYGISGARRKELLWESTINYAVARKDRRAIIMGDFNTGFRIDTEGEMFAMSNYMTKLIDIGFVDGWRHLHGQAREYTWYSKRKDKATGKSQDLNGFRLDYIFLSPALQHAIMDASILHKPRTAGVSDHASVVANIGLSERVAGSEIGLQRELTTSSAEPSGAEIGETMGEGGWPAGTEVAINGKFLVHFDLAPGSLCDMKCGLNGEGFVQDFRPTYVTAEWAGSVLKEVQIWGPRILRDGSLGKRILDHQWRRPVADGGVKYSELPPSVAAQLRSHIARKGVDAPPQ